MRADGTCLLFLVSASGPRIALTAGLLPRSHNIAAPRAAYFQEMTARGADQGHALVQWTA
jgi:hypothetical protein